MKRAKPMTLAAARKQIHELEYARDMALVDASQLRVIVGEREASLAMALGALNEALKIPKGWRVAEVVRTPENP